MNDNQKKKKFSFKISRKMALTLGIWLVIGGILIVSSDYLKSKKMDVYDTISFQLSDSQVPQEIIAEAGEATTDEEINDTTTDSGGESSFVNQSYYVGRIEIPKINLIKGFAAYGSPYNDVNKNVAIMETSTYPDVDKGNFILAAHTGNAWNCFFRNLYKLQTGDLVYIYYNGNKYTYQQTNFYTQYKDGTVTILRDLQETTLTLITCTVHTYDRQSIYIYKLIAVEKV